MFSSKTPAERAPARTSLYMLGLKMSGEVPALEKHLSAEHADAIPPHLRLEAALRCLINMVDLLTSVMHALLSREAHVGVHTLDGIGPSIAQGGWNEGPSTTANTSHASPEPLCAWTSAMSLSQSGVGECARGHNFADLGATHMISPLDWLPCEERTRDSLETARWRKSAKGVVWKVMPWVSRRCVSFGADLQTRLGFNSSGSVRVRKSPQKAERDDPGEMGASPPGGFFASPWSRGVEEL